jgi:hypothetical protein
VDGGYEYLAEDGLVEMFVDGYFAAPMSPFVLFHVPVVVVAEPSLWELDLDQ